MKKIDAIIPALNEEKTIGSVIRVVKQSPLVHRVIVVSDGSSDRTTQEAKKAGADVIEHSMPRGKGAAILTGVNETKSETVLLLDADLTGLTTSHIKALAHPVLAGKVDMNIGLRDKGILLSSVQRFLPLISGERALQTSILRNVSPRFLQGYMLETALNQYCQSRHLRVSTVFLKGLSIIRKYEKVGIAAGFLGYIKMGFQLVNARVLIGLARLRGRF